MSNLTAIEWTDATWNPVRGCSRVSEGCRNCYAERVAARFSGAGLPYHGFADMTPRGPRWTGRVELVPGKLAEPLGWRRPRRVFVNSMSDLFHEELGFEDIAAVWGIMAACPRHTFQILTKRPERMRDWFLWMREFALSQRDIVSAPSMRQAALKAAFTAMGETGAAERRLGRAWEGDGARGPWPLPNVWIGVSVEDQATADARVPLLLELGQVAVRFVSAEPLLGPLDLSQWLMDKQERHDRRTTAYQRFALQARALPPNLADPAAYTASLDWVIAGGESGPGARPAQREWARLLRDQCEAAGAAFFFKQWGEHAPNWLHHRDGREVPGSVWMDRVGKRAAGRLLDGREHNGFPGGGS
jgi:protein gp37